MISLTLDRLLMSILSIKYQITVTKRKTKITLAVSWMTGNIFGVILYFLKPEQETYVLKTCFFPTSNMSFIITALITYSYILYQLINRKRRLNTNSKGSSKTDGDKTPKRRNNLAKFYFVTGFIVLSFTFLIAIPSTVKLIHYQNYLHRRISITLHFVNYAVDPCIYIFLQPSVRKLLKSKVTMCWDNSNNN